VGSAWRGNSPRDADAEYIELPKLRPNQSCEDVQC
jgi:hypothetical protein